MKPSASQASKSKKRNRALIAKFAARAIAKNDRGIIEHGGGLSEKNTLPEMMAEIMDLVNYAVEHEEQVEKLVAAATRIADRYIFNSPTGKTSSDEITALCAALAPFLNNESQITKRQ
jgi:hypothetical protein